MADSSNQTPTQKITQKISRAITKTLNRAVRTTTRFLKAEDGPTAVEYAVMLAFIIIVCYVAVQVVGQKTNSAFQNSTLGNAIG